MLFRSLLRRATFVAVSTLALWLGAESRAEAALVSYTRYALPNGLVVILHEDHALPIVAVNIAYRVGSRFEQQGRTGFAHLFEHLMFMGTQRAPTKMFDAWMEGEGGWNNAWTSEDRTDYFDVGPSHSLPLLLWLEADRLSSLADEMNLEKLDAQREVVRNERRQTSENTPYGKVELRLPELLYPPEHPYHHPVIGSHEDLQAAAVDDVKSFFHRWYAPNNASLVVAGDFKPEDVKARVASLFGSIPRVDVAAAPPASLPKLAGIVRETIPDDVKLPKVIMAWHSAAHFAAGDAELDLAAAVLEDGKASRLYKALVYDKSLAQDVAAAQHSQDLSSYFTVEAIARPGVSLDKLEAAMTEQVARIASEPVSDAELSRAENQYETSFVSRLQSVQQRAAMLNLYQMAVGDPGFAEKDLDRYRKASKDSILAISRATFDPRALVVIRVVPREVAPAAKPAPAPTKKPAAAASKGGKK